MATKPVQMHHITAHPSGPIEPQSDEKLNLAPNIAIGKQFWFNGVLPGDAAPAAPPPIHDQTALNLDLYRGNVVYRVSTTRIPEDQSGIKLERLAQMLDRELNGTREWDVGSLITDLFTDKALGVEIDSYILDWLHEDGVLVENHFTEFYSPTEISVADFLNRIGAAFVETFKTWRDGQFPALKRSWSSDYFNKILPGSPIERKPDIILLDLPPPDPLLSFSSKPAESGLTWLNVRSVAEVTSRGTFHQTLKNTIDAKTYIMFLTQHDRNFVPMLSFFGDQCLLTVTDRESQQYSKVLQLGDGRRDDLLSFFRVLIGFMFGDESLLGIDTSMTRNKEDKIAEISVFDDKGRAETFEVVAPLYSVQSLLGRGTKVWQVKKGKKHYVLKDSWILATRPSEVATLNALKGVPGVPTVIQGGVVYHPELTAKQNTLVPLRTTLFRLTSKGVTRFARERRRFVEAPHAEPLTKFPNRLGLCIAFRDFVKTSEEIAKKGFVHRDISFNNLMIYTPDVPQEDVMMTGDSDDDNILPDPGCRGIMIDYDYASKLNRREGMILGSFGGRTGTAPFMALSILRRGGVNILRTPAHDLESMCYTLFHTLTSCDGLKGMLRDIKASSISLPLLEWFLHHNGTYRKLGRIKQGQLADVETNIFDHFTPYFNNLKPLARNLFNVLFPRGPLEFAPEPKITHDTMLRIFDETITLLRRYGDDYDPPVPRPIENRSKSRPRSPSRARSGGPTYLKKCSIKAVSTDLPEKLDKRSRTGTSDFSVVSGDLSSPSSAVISTSAMSSEGSVPVASRSSQADQQSTMFIVRRGSSTGHGRRGRVMEKVVDRS